jgi:hypothetical protein
MSRWVTTGCVRFSGRPTAPEHSTNDALAAKHVLVDELRGLIDNAGANIAQ